MLDRNSNVPTSKDWLTEAETCVHRASDLVLLSVGLEECEFELDAAAAFLQPGLAPRPEPLDADTHGRLEALLKELLILQSVAKYGIALDGGVEQLDPTAVVGYSPSGLELAF
ncbi:MAG: hypothetical protein ABI811_18955 [Acidobacteriota bacterium]